jgi:undecaprenyl-phosphate 4-deoxy-4-formamido-L-arabinose transferase
MNPEITIVIPVYNEEDVLETLYGRLMPVLDGLDRTFEVIFTNDGSHDRSIDILRSFHERRPQHIRVIDFNGNFGQHMAIMAAFEQSRGEIVINLDADLQNPPESIPCLLKAVDQGHDYVGTIRQKRNDSWIRDWPSKFMNWLRGKATNIHITDQGCMMRAYSRRIVQLITSCQEASTFITALGYSFAINPTEVTIPHEPRTEGESKYGLFQLIHVAFDLFTGFSMWPIHIIVIMGTLGAFLSGGRFLFLLIQEIVWGTPSQDYHLSFSITYFLLSLGILSIGMVGEYVGRIYHVVRHRPRFLIKNMIEGTFDKNTPTGIAPTKNIQDPL